MQALEEYQRLFQTQPLAASATLPRAPAIIPLPNNNTAVSVPANLTGTLPSRLARALTSIGDSAAAEPLLRAATLLPAHTGPTAANSAAASREVSRDDHENSPIPEGGIDIAAVWLKANSLPQVAEQLRCGEGQAWEARENLTHRQLEMLHSRVKGVHTAVEAVRTAAMAAGSVDTALADLAAALNIRA